MTLQFRVSEGGTLIDVDSSHSSDRQALGLSPLLFSVRLRNMSYFRL